MQFPNPEMFEQWQAFIESKVGFVLPDRQDDWVVHTINRLSKQENITQSELLYRASLENRLAQQVIDAILIPQSRFFRHPSTLTLLAKQFTDYLQSSDESQDSYKVWSVGCSYGQETWSIGLVLYHQWQKQLRKNNDLKNLASQSSIDAPHIDDMSKPYSNSQEFVIWGSDVSQTALKHAQVGIYQSANQYEVPKKYHAYLQDDTEFNLNEVKPNASMHEVLNRQKTWTPIAPIHERVTFFQHNLFEFEKGLANYPELEALDAVVCQNVLIYFRQFDQRDILNHLARRLKIGGLLVVAPGEASLWHHPCMQPVKQKQVTAWRKVSEIT